MVKIKNHVKAAIILFMVGHLLLIEGLLVQTDFTQYGIPSIIIQLGTTVFWLHHWIIGLGLVVSASAYFLFFGIELLYKYGK